MVMVREDGRSDTMMTEICLLVLSVFMLIDSLNFLMLKIN